MRRKPSDDDAPEFAGELITLDSYNIIKLDENPEFHNNVRVRDVDRDTKRLKKITSFVRSSLEYKKYMKYLKTNLNMNACSYYHNMNSSESKKGLKIEIHHSPFTLFDIVYAVANRHISDHGYADEFDVGDEVMKLHYMNMVGLIPISTTIHEMVHSGAMDVDPRLTYGFWKIFINQYKDFFSMDMALKLETIREWDTLDKGTIPQKLAMRYTMLQFQGVTLYEELNPTTNIPKLTVLE